MPRDVRRKISCHDLKRIVDNLNPPPVIRVCGVDCHRGGEYCNGYCEGKAPEPLLFPPGKPWGDTQACSSVCDLGGPCDVTGRHESHRMDEDLAPMLAVDEDKESEMKRWLEDKMKQVRVNVAARDLVKLVEGTTDEYRRNGARLKDSEEWAKFFLAVRRLDSENIPALPPKVGSGEGSSDAAKPSSP